CVLGQTVVDYLFADDPIDKVIRVKGLPCKVVGVFEAKGFSANGQDQDDFVVMPFTTVQKRSTGTFWLDDIFVSAISRSAMPEALKEIEQLLLVVAVVQSYYTLVVSQRKYATAQRAANEGERFFKITQQLEQGGEVAHSDVRRQRSSTSSSSISTIAPLPSIKMSLL